MAAMSDEDLAKLTPVEFVRGLKQTVLFQDEEHRLVLYEYKSIPAPDLFIEFLDEEGDWCDQIPFPIDAERARAIAAGLVAWADSQVEPPAPNRFDSVEVSGLVEPIGVITDGPK